MNKLKNRDTRTTGKIKIESEYFSYNSYYPAFSFKYLQDKFDLKSCNKKSLKILLSFIQKISQSTWQMIKQAPREGIGYEKISYLKKTIPSELSEKIFISFRGSIKARFIGFREQQIFYLVWIDINGDVYKH